MQCHVHFNPRGIHMNKRLFDSIIDKMNDSEKMVRVDVWFPTKSSAKESLGKIPMGIHPTNFLYKSFELNMSYIVK